MRPLTFIESSDYSHTAGGVTYPFLGRQILPMRVAESAKAGWIWELGNSLTRENAENAKPNVSVQLTSCSQIKFSSVALR